MARTRQEKFLDPDGGKAKAYIRSSTQEKLLAKRGNTEVVRGSGSGDYDKGDVRGYKGKVTIEAKCTSAKSFSVNRNTLTKLEDAACAKSELPLLVVEFLDKFGDPETELAILPMYVLDELLDNQRE